MRTRTHKRRRVIAFGGWLILATGCSAANGVTASPGIGIVVAVTKDQIAAGVAGDVRVDAPGSSWLPVNRPSVGSRTELGALYPVRLFDVERSRSPQVLASQGFDVSPTTLSAYTTGISYRGGPWTDARGGLFLNGEGSVLRQRAYFGGRETLIPAGFVGVRLTAPLFEFGRGYGWEFSWIAGFRGYKQLGGSYAL